MEAFVVVGLDSGSNILSGSRASNHNDEHLTLRLPLRPNLTLPLPLPPSVTCLRGKDGQKCSLRRVRRGGQPKSRVLSELVMRLGLEPPGTDVLPIS
jgi:hypothetical protein